MAVFWKNAAGEEFASVQVRLTLTKANYDKIVAEAKARNQVISDPWTVPGLITAHAQFGLDDLVEEIDDYAAAAKPTEA